MKNAGTKPRIQTPVKTRPVSGHEAALSKRVTAEDPGRWELLSADELAALRAWHEGLSARNAVEQYLPEVLKDGASARGVIGRLRARLVAHAEHLRQPDLAATLGSPLAVSRTNSRAFTDAVELLQRLPVRTPQLDDEIETWLPLRPCRALRAVGICTLAQLTLRVPRRRQWWKAIPDLGRASARDIESFFASHADLSRLARQLLVPHEASAVVPWERLVLPPECDGREGRLRGAPGSSSLGAVDDRAAIQAWLDLRESETTQRAYRKEVERYVLWCVLERGRAFSSAMAEDALAYRKFLRRPAPASRWIGPVRPRASGEWRPFAKPLSRSSIAYALSVINALYGWLVQQRYLTANPFAGVRVSGDDAGGVRARALDEATWDYVIQVADVLEVSHGWSDAAARRLRFILRFCQGTGLRAQELVDAKLGDIELSQDAQGEWLHLRGKGGRVAKVSLPPQAWQALTIYLRGRGLADSPRQWPPEAPLLAGLVAPSDLASRNADVESSRLPGRALERRISTSRLRAILERFFALASDLLQKVDPPLAAKLLRVSTHWLRHTHATHALHAGVELVVVRDNLRHASIATTSRYLDEDDQRRSEQLARAFGAMRTRR